MAGRNKGKQKNRIKTNTKLNFFLHRFFLKYFVKKSSLLILLVVQKNCGKIVQFQILWNNYFFFVSHFFLLHIFLKIFLFHRVQPQSGFFSHIFLKSVTLPAWKIRKLYFFMGFTFYLINIFANLSWSRLDFIAFCWDERQNKSHKNQFLGPNCNFQ